MDEDSGMLDVWAVRFGPQNVVRFIVCEPIDTPLEMARSTFCVDGQWPSLMLHGDEKKIGYIGTVTKRDMPEQIQDVLTAFEPVMKECRYRNQFSMELRDKVFIDPAAEVVCPAQARRCRCGRTCRKSSGPEPAANSWSPSLPTRW